MVLLLTMGRLNTLEPTQKAGQITLLHALDSAPVVLTGTCGQIYQTKACAFV